MKSCRAHSFPLLDHLLDHLLEHLLDHLFVCFIIREVAVAVLTAEKPA
jgi:hypothetical protein